jgi:Na+/melibiose symporter-like transporter
MLLSNWYALLMLLVLLWATIIAITQGNRTQWQGLAIMWLVITAILSWSIYRSLRTSAKEYADLERISPAFLKITPEGVQSNGLDNATAFTPWSHFQRWREGRHVIVLDHLCSNAVSILPISHLQETERHALRSLLSLYLPVDQT